MSAHLPITPGPSNWMSAHRAFAVIEPTPFMGKAAMRTPSRIIRPQLRWIRQMQPIRPGGRAVTCWPESLKRHCGMQTLPYLFCLTMLKDCLCAGKLCPHLAATRKPSRRFAWLWRDRMRRRNRGRRCAVWGFTVTSLEVLITY